MIPAGFEVTVPVPVPVRKTVRLAWPTTVSVVLAVAPDASVAVMVVTPAPTAVARPVPSTVATDVALLVHVTPVAAHRRRDSAEPVVVPLPNWPHSFAPQHRTLPSWQERAAVVPPPGREADGGGDSADTAPVSSWSASRPSPSCPDSFCPQHRSVPSFKERARVSPPAGDRDGVVMPDTCTGVE